MKNFWKEVIYLLNGALIMLVILWAADMAVGRAQASGQASLQRTLEKIPRDF